MSEESGKAGSSPWFPVKVAAFVLIGFAIIGLGRPHTTGGKKAHRAEAVSNAKRIGLALITFREDYGSYPCGATAAMVRKYNPDTSSRLGNKTANDFFRQMIATGMMDQEKPFYARTISSHKPDNVLTGPKMLEKGEVGFAYVVSHAACREKDIPIILTPLVKGKPLFDYEGAKKNFDGNKAVILWTDCSVTIETVNKHGRVILNGKDFFDPSQPYWHGIPPKVAWPE
jgi:hypothetical protein